MPTPNRTLRTSEVSTPGSGLAPLPRRDFLALGGGALVAAATVLDAPSAVAAAVAVHKPEASVSIGFLPASVGRDPSVTTSRVIHADRVRAERFSGHVEVTVHNLAGSLSEPVQLLAYFPAADASAPPHAYHAARRDATAAGAAQPVRFRMPVDAAGGVSFALAVGQRGEEVLLPFRLSAGGEPGVTPLSRGTYFVAADPDLAAQLNWSAYHVEPQTLGTGLQRSSLLLGDQQAEGAEFAHAVISVRQAPAL